MLLAWAFERKRVAMSAEILVAYTVNATGETLVLNKDFPSIKQGFCQHNGGKVGKIVIFPALSKYFPSIKMGKSLFSTRVSPVTFTVYLNIWLYLYRGIYFADKTRQGVIRFRIGS